MNLRTLAILSSVALLAPSLASEARAQRPGNGPPPRYDRDVRSGPDRARVDRYAYERARERERLAASAFRDGYDAGLRAGRDRRRYDPARESRYRSADRGYQRDFGPRDAYRWFYRDSFANGYERGYWEAVRYDRRGPTLWWRW